MKRRRYDKPQVFSIAKTQFRQVVRDALLARASAQRGAQLQSRLRRDADYRAVNAQAACRQAQADLAQYRGAE